MKKKQAIQLAGGSAKALADLFGISESAVSQWGEDLPVLRVYQLRELKPKWFARARHKQAVSAEQT